MPHDMSIVGFDDIRLAEFTEPPLTTVRLPRGEPAERVLQALLIAAASKGRNQNSKRF